MVIPNLSAYLIRHQINVLIFIMTKFQFKIRNIKHYGDVPEPISLDLSHRRLNYIVAPNGAGKTSFVTAFECLNTGRINVPKEFKHKKQERPASSLTITVDGNEWAATGRKNRITSYWNPFVINSRIINEVVVVGGERGALLNEAQTKVRRIKIIDNIPAQIHVTYDFNAIKAAFGAKRNALRDYTVLFDDKKFLMGVSKSLPALYQFNYYDVAKSRISALVDEINRKAGNAAGLRVRMTDADFKTMEQYKNYKVFKDAFVPILGAGAHKLDYFLLFYQLFEVYKEHTDEIKNAVAWAVYETQKMDIEKNLACVKCPWQGATLKEDNGALYIDFPLADEYSNGERDIMTLYAQLMLFSSKLQANKKYLLLIDEVFDYLDDANLLAAQYFVSQLLDKASSSEVYIVLFTHLDPTYYRTYVLKQLIKVDYLVKVQAIPNTSTKWFIGYRDWLKEQGNNGDEDKLQLYHDLSNFLFHYHPTDCNYSSQIVANQHPTKEAKSTWGKKTVFYTYLIDEVNKYLSGQNYDPYAVAFAIRIRIEKIAYDSIDAPAVKNDFLVANDSLAKIKVCTDRGIKVPLFYMMVLAIGNESAHLKMINGNYEEKGMVFKLRNLSVKRIVEQIFDKQDGVLVSLQSIG